jgi:hypothetical protein
MSNLVPAVHFHHMDETVPCDLMESRPLANTDDHVLADLAVVAARRGSHELWTLCITEASRRSPDLRREIISQAKEAGFRPRKISWLGKVRSSVTTEIERFKTARPPGPRGTGRLYFILYDRQDMKPRRFQLYVGETQATIDERYATHMRGGKGAARGVHLHGEGLLRSLCVLSPEDLTRQEAEKLETQIGVVLKRRVDPVFVRGPQDPERKSAHDATVVGSIG